MNVHGTLNMEKNLLKNEQNEIVNYLGHDYIEGLTLLGGEPLEKVNQEGLLPLVKEVKENIQEKQFGVTQDLTLKKMLWEKC